MSHYVDRIERFLRDTGATWTWGRTRGDHRRLTVTLGERKVIQIVAMTPSDPRGCLNTIADLRHQLGIVPTEKRTGERRTRKRRGVAAPPQMPALTMRADRFGGPLAEIAEAMTVPEIPAPPQHAIVTFRYAP